VSTRSVKEEDSGVSSGLSAGNSEANPVDNRLILSLAHSPDISDFNVVGHVDLSSLLVNNIDGTIVFDLEGLVVRAVLLGFLGHQTNVRYISHS